MNEKKSTSIKLLVFDIICILLLLVCIYNIVDEAILGRGIVPTSYEYGMYILTAILFCRLFWRITAGVGNASKITISAILSLNFTAIIFLVNGYFIQIEYLPIEAPLWIFLKQSLYSFRNRVAFTAMPFIMMFIQLCLPWLWKTLNALLDRVIDFVWNIFDNDKTKDSSVIKTLEKLIFEDDANENLTVSDHLQNYKKAANNLMRINQNNGFTNEDLSEMLSIALETNDPTLYRILLRNADKLSESERNTVKERCKNPF